MIGGEFELAVIPDSSGFISALDTYYYASGRSALYQILKSLTPKHRKVWLPDYLCFTIIEAVARAGYNYAFYEIDDALMASLNALDSAGFENGDIVLLINYFGLLDLRGVSKTIKSAFPGAIVIEDDVQAFYSFAEETNPYADYRFTSLRKTLPVPDGGLVYSHKQLPRVSGLNTFSEYKIRAGLMKNARGKEGVKDEDYLALFKKGEMLINDNYEAGMSDEGKCLFAEIDYAKVKKQRQVNAEYLLLRLKELGIAPLIPIPQNAVPLFVPIVLPERDRVRSRMFANDVFCPVHWPIYGNLKLKKGLVLSEQELSLVVDQRYSIEDMDRIISLL